MNELEEMFNLVQKESSDLQLKLLRGEIDYEDSTVQYFLPVILHFTEYDWLKIIAKNILIEEDEKIVEEFLDKVKTLCEINNNLLIQAVVNFKELFGE